MLNPQPVILKLGMPVQVQAADRRDHHEQQRHLRRGQAPAGASGGSFQGHEGRQLWQRP